MCAMQLQVLPRPPPVHPTYIRIRVADLNRDLEAVVWVYSGSRVTLSHVVFLVS